MSDLPDGFVQAFERVREASQLGIVMQTRDVLFEGGTIRLQGGKAHLRVRRDSSFYEAVAFHAESCAKKKPSRRKGGQYDTYTFEFKRNP